MVGFLPSLEALFNNIEGCGITEKQFFYHDINVYEQDMEIIESMKDISNEKTNIATLLKKD